MHCRKFHHAHQRVTPDLERLLALKEPATGKRVESRCAYLYWLSALSHAMEVWDAVPKANIRRTLASMK
jgi:hypothetical protein